MYNLTVSGLSLPPQMIPVKQKKDKWKKLNLDILENIGISQISEKGKLLENYEMLKGKFIFKHYIEDEEYQDLVGLLTTEFNIPSRLRHYDIISQVVNTLLGEMQKRPDIFTVKCFDEGTKNRFVADKTQLLLKYVTSEIENWVELKLAEEGLTLEGQQFESEEEQQQFINQVESRKKELTPEEIDRFMATQWTESAEIWANAVLQLDEQRFDLKDKKAVEFLDMLASDQCYRHFYLTGTGYAQETWNPLSVFSSVHGDNNETEKGEYVGRITYMSFAEVIDRFGHKMTEQQIASLEKFRKNEYDGSTDKYEEFGAKDRVIPYLNYPEHKQMTQILGRDPLAPNDHTRAVILDEMDYTGYELGKCRVTEAYWMSQKMIGKFCFYDMETGQIRHIIVDESFDLKLFPGVKEVKGTFNEEYKQLPNTIVWTYINEVYKGVKISIVGGESDSDLYIDIGPNEFQAKGDLELYGAKLPVVGGIFNGRNGESMPLVSLMKPHQIGYNVSMNQTYEIMQREKGRFMLMDVNAIPSDKDWGGPRNYERFMMIAKELGIAPVDASPANTKNSSFAHYQVIDMDESARMLNRLKIAETFENFALKQVGITPQRLGSVAASETATGTQQAVNQSYAQTETYFTKFYSYVKRCMTMNLDIAQFCAVGEKDITLTYTMSDLSRGFIKINGNQLTGKMFGLYVVDSQEVKRQLETVRQLFLNNANTGALPEDMVTAIVSNSIAELQTQLKASRIKKEKEVQAQREHEQQMQQQQIQAAQEANEKQIAKEDERLDKELAVRVQIAEINQMGRLNQGLGSDTDGDGIYDVLQLQQMNQQIGRDTQDFALRSAVEKNKQTDTLTKRLNEERKLSLEQQKTNNERLKTIEEGRLKEKELNLKNKEIDTNLAIAKENKNKYDNKGKK